MAILQQNSLGVLAILDGDGGERKVLLLLELFRYPEGASVERWVKLSGAGKEKRGTVVGLKEEESHGDCELWRLSEAAQHLRDGGLFKAAAEKYSRSF